MRELILDYLAEKELCDFKMLFQIFGLNIQQLIEIFPELRMLQVTNQQYLMFGDTLLYDQDININTYNQYYYHFPIDGTIKCYRTDDRESFYPQLFDHADNTKIVGEVDYYVEYEDLDFQLFNPLAIFQL